MSAIEWMERASGFLPRLRVEAVLVDQENALAKPAAPVRWPYSPETEAALKPMFYDAIGE